MTSQPPTRCLRYFCVLLMLCCSGQIWAHAKLVRSDPAARAVVKRSPERIRLWFNEKLEPAYSSAELRDHAGTVLSKPKAEVPAADGKLLQLEIPTLVDGRYTVHFRVLSVDGHVIEAQIHFTVRALR